MIVQTTLLGIAVALMLMGVVLSVSAVRAPQPSPGQWPQGRALHHLRTMVALFLVGAVLLCAAAFL